MLEDLYNKEFYWNLSMDENRAIDGVELRHMFQSETGKRTNFLKPCNVLEMLVALAIRCNDGIICDVEEQYGYWFWTFIKNLGLIDMTDDISDSIRIVRTDEILEKWLNREYDYDGNGGLFPLKYPDKDQKNVDIWSQMGYFLDETYF